MAGREPNVIASSEEIADLDIDLDMAANVYSLLNGLEHLEHAYIAGNAPVTEYEEECLNLLSLCNIVEDTRPNIFVELSKAYKLKCPLALRRLQKGVPASREGRDGSVSPRNEMYLMFELSEHFITLLDALKLGCSLVEELFPLVHELIGCMKCIQVRNATGIDYSSMVPIVDKMEKWQKRLENMAAHEKLEADGIRQLAMDTEAAYGSFKTYLRKK